MDFCVCDVALHYEPEDEKVFCGRCFLPLPRLRRKDCLSQIAQYVSSAVLLNGKLLASTQCLQCPSARRIDLYLVSTCTDTWFATAGATLMAMNSSTPVQKVTETNRLLLNG